MPFSNDALLSCLTTKFFQSSIFPSRDSSRKYTVSIADIPNMSMMLFTIFSFLLGGWVAGSGAGDGLILGWSFDGAGKGDCFVGWGRMGCATGCKEIICSASGGCTVGSAAVLCESAVMF